MVCLSIWQAKRLRLDRHTEQLVLQSIPMVTIVAIVPACLSDVILRRAQFVDNPLGFGMTFYGWMVGCIFGWCIYATFTNLRPWFLLDFFSPSLALAHAFGRIGCFLGGCCHGRPTMSCIGVRFPAQSIPWMRYGNLPLYPVQLIESIWLFVVFTLLLRRIPFRHRMAAYLILVGTGRFFAEFLRGDERGDFFGIHSLSPAQFLSAFMVGSGILTEVFRIYGKSGHIHAPLWLKRNAR